MVLPCDVQSTMFQDDIFPPTREPVFVATADEWIGGKKCVAKMYNLKDGFKANSRTATKPAVKPQMAPKKFSAGGAVKAAGAGGAPTDLGQVSVRALGF